MCDIFGEFGRSSESNSTTNKKSEQKSFDDSLEPTIWERFFKCNEQQDLNCPIGHVTYQYI